MPSVASTNQYALEIESGPTPMAPLLVGCDDQRAGRGRRGRNWVSQPAHSLTFSLVFERQVAPQESLAGYSLVVGLSLCEALSHEVAGLGLKWPNDLLRDGRKCAGILVETRRFDGPGALRIERVVCGIGLNLRAPEGLPSEMRPAVTGLYADRSVDDSDRARLVARIARAQLEAWHRFSREGLGPTLSGWARFDTLQGKPVQVLADPLQPDSHVMQGLAHGVADDGALLIATEHGVRKVYAGEISVRPLALE